MSQTGNAHMLRAILNRLNYDEFEPVTFSIGNDPIVLSNLMKYQMINVNDDGNWPAKFFHLLKTYNFDCVFIVGHDIWNFIEIHHQILEARTQMKFIWAWLFPYDLQSIRKDCVKIMNDLDAPLVYSEYGFNMLKEHVPRIEYFRPPMDSAGIYRMYSLEEKTKTRKEYFKSIKGGTFIFGFVGPNQFRKDPQTLLKAFKTVKDKHPDTILYLHCDLHKGEFNLPVYMIDDCGFKSGDIYTMGGLYDENKMPDLYNCFDCYVNCSMQEGLSWTILNAMACGVPVIASNTTAHPELLTSANGERIGELVPCEEARFLPIKTSLGQSWIPAKGCNDIDIAKAMIAMIETRETREKFSILGVEKAKQWLDGVSDINIALLKAIKVQTENDKIMKNGVMGRQDKLSKVLFAQHSSGGDVLMTTRCLKGIKARHPDLDLVYMTSEQYMDIVEGHPSLSEVIPWDENNQKDYEFVYNPHGERILPGHWGRNSNSLLSDFYWKILDVEPDDFFIGMKIPRKHDVIIQAAGVAKNLVIVHTTGGDAEFRTYKYMADVCKALENMGYLSVQIGGRNDYPAGANLDLRGEFTFQETAWVMDKASLAITVDSFVSHLAGALGVSQICLFGSGNAYVVRPNQMKGELICMVPNYLLDCPGLGPCSASVRDCPTPCTGRHNPDDIINNVNELKSKGMVRRNYEHETSCYSLRYVG